MPMVFMGACKKDKVISESNTIVGTWNLYEYTREGVLHTEVCHCMTFFYEDGAVFSEDGKYIPRYLNENSWSERDQGIIFEQKNKTIFMRNSSGTSGENELELKIIKLEKDRLWFSHTLSGHEREFHLVRNK